MDIRTASPSTKTLDDIRKTVHWAKECKNPKKEKDETHLAQVDDDEPTVHGHVLCAARRRARVEGREVVTVVEQGKALQAIHLDESCAQVHLGRVADGME